MHKCTHTLSPPHLLYFFFSSFPLSFLLLFLSSLFLPSLSLLFFIIITQICPEYTESFLLGPFSKNFHPMLPIVSFLQIFLPFLHKYIASFPFSKALFREFSSHVSSRLTLYPTLLQPLLIPCLYLIHFCWRQHSPLKCWYPTTTAAAATTTTQKNHKFYLQPMSFP